MAEYRSRTVQDEVDAQFRRLDAHHANPDNGLCVACRDPAPCSDANDAAGFLAERGLLAPLPEPQRRTLLTHAWELWFGFLGRTR